MKVYIQLCLVGILCAIASAKKCIISADCKNNQGREVCYNQECHKDIPCNKDNDCFFWGAADVAYNFPHPRCYDFPHVQREPGYGTCLLVEFADHLFNRIPGEDVANIKEDDPTQ
ncbi:uncharacterized protein LOC135471831 [Liolophura sinensis]|uniref:uncharacterized protein LOC135471831 n=1 Tax=Liolophura sinensis TaxID=3198878 RepID=UPI0031588D90